MNHDYPPLFGRRLARFVADEGRWRKLCGPWFAKPAPRFFRSKSQVRTRLAPLRGRLSGS
ncbi:MAG: hypothetical protein WDM96_09565 [Lacunisphaera sp.]